MNSKKAIVIFGDNISKHILRVFALMIDYYRWNLFVIFWGNKNVDNSLLIKSFDLDKILNLDYKILPMFNNKDVTRAYFEKVNPKLLIFVGDFHPKILKDIPDNNIPKILIGKIINSNLTFNKIIKDSIIAKITNTDIDYIPQPRVNYQDFLDFDTGESLKIKQNNNLITYKNGIISKQNVIGYLTNSNKSKQLIQLIQDQGYKYLNLQDISNSEILIPEIDEDTAPIIFEVMDMLVIDKEIDEQTIQYILWGLASGTILILPRKEKFVNFVGNGAIYYQEDSNTELKACLQILKVNSKKIQEIRDNAMIVLQKKFSYKSIAKSWETVFDKFNY